MQIRVATARSSLHTLWQRKKVFLGLVLRSIIIVPVDYLVKFSTSLPERFSASRKGKSPGNEVGEIL